MEVGALFAETAESGGFGITGRTLDFVYIVNEVGPFPLLSPQRLIQ